MADFVIIVAAGTGQRMNSALPKQFHVLDKIPVLMRTLHQFHRTTFQPHILLVLAPDWVDYWTDLCYKFRFHVPHHIVEGGATRFESVQNALQHIRETHAAALLSKSSIAVHDGARPLVSADLIDEVIRIARSTGAAAPALSCADSVRLSDPDTAQNKSFDRARVHLMQTPQVFSAEILLKAYLQNYEDSFTDDSSVVEKLGKEITLIEGEKTNLKITTTDDLIIASAYLRQLRE